MVEACGRRNLLTPGQKGKAKRKKGWHFDASGKCMFYFTHLTHLVKALPPPSNAKVKMAPLAFRGRLNTCDPNLRGAQCLSQTMGVVLSQTPEWSVDLISSWILVLETEKWILKSQRQKCVEQVFVRFLPSWSCVYSLAGIYSGVRGLTCGLLGRGRGKNPAPPPPGRDKADAWPI